MRTEFNDFYTTLLPETLGRRLRKQKKLPMRSALLAAKRFRCCAFEQIIIPTQLSAVT